MKKVRWGVLSTAKIGLEKVIPAMQIGKYSEIAACVKIKVRYNQRKQQITQMHFTG